ncbi:MAG: DUF6049 family protein [Ferrimicrobium sp.]
MTGQTEGQLLIPVPVVHLGAVAPTLGVGVVAVVAPSRYSSSFDTRLHGTLRALDSDPLGYTLAGSPLSSLSTLLRVSRKAPTSSVHARLSGLYAPTTPACLDMAPSHEAGFAANLSLQTRATGASTTTVVLPEGLTARQFQYLKGTNTHTVVLPEYGVSRLAPLLSLSSPIAVTGSGIRFIEADKQLSTELSKARTPIARQRLQADLAQFYFEAPSQVNRATVILVTVHRASELSALQRSISEIAINPVVSLLGLSQIRSLPAINARLSGLTATSSLVCHAASSRFKATVHLLHAIAGAAPQSPPPVGIVNIEAQLSMALSTFQSSALRSESLGLAVREIHGLVSQVSLAGSRTVTLTSHRAQIPISLSSRLGFPLSVSVRVSSSKLGFPSGNTQRLVLHRGSVTIAVPVVGKALGSFPASVSILSPNGTILERSALVVDSTAFSAAGVLLTVGAGMVVVVWWIRSGIRSRRRRRESVGQ